jgi:hypothetical protein
MWQTLKSDFTEFIRSAGEEGGTASKCLKAADQVFIIKKITLLI